MSSQVLMPASAAQVFTARTGVPAMPMQHIETVSCSQPNVAASWLVTMDCVAVPPLQAAVLPGARMSQVRLKGWLGSRATQGCGLVPATLQAGAAYFVVSSAGRNVTDGGQAFTGSER